MRRAVLLLPLALLTGAAPTIATRARLGEANRAAAAADARSRALTGAAANERDAARRAALEEAAVAARIGAAEQRLAAATARVTIIGRLLGEARAALIERQAPILRLVGALQSLARRPPALALAQPGSASDLVHVRALLGTMLPVVQARSTAVRAELTRVRRLRGDAALAASGLRQGRARLESERVTLVRTEAEHRLRGESLGRAALIESDRAIALGERARDIVDLMAETSAAAMTGEGLATLPGPLPRPGEDEPVAAFAVPPYRLPVTGRLVEGLGELSDTGVRSRGLTWVAAPNAPVVAPAAGRVLFARHFRDYGVVVVIDHGEGWTSALTGLSATGVRAGEAVAAGAPLGRVPATDEPRVTVELRRRDMPIDLTQLLN